MGSLEPVTLNVIFPSELERGGREEQPSWRWGELPSPPHPPAPSLTSQVPVTSILSEYFKGTVSPL